MFLLVFYWSLLKVIKSWTHEMPTRKNLRPTKYPREKVWDLGNTHEKKIGTHEIPTKKSLRSTKYPRKKVWDARNTHEKIFWTHKIPTGKIFGPTKARWHSGTRPTRPTMARDPRNLARSGQLSYIKCEISGIDQKLNLCVSVLIA